ncbi:MIP/aquaporin family protein [soil metagenome]
MECKLGGKLVAEFLGVFALCLVGILAINNAAAIGLVGIALAHGLILAIMVSACMQTSGGHFNPAVTLGFVVTGKMKPGAALLYVIAQLAGGLAASLVVVAIKGSADAVAAGTPNFNPENVSVMQAILIEAIATFFLVFAVWGTAADPRAKSVAGFGIGLTVAADILAFGPLTGASMNPARSFGPALIGMAAADKGFLLSQLWVYFAGPCIGAVVAAFTYYTLLFPHHPERSAADVPPEAKK